MCRSDGTRPFSGDVGEVMLFSQSLTNEEVVSTEQYLLAKWVDLTHEFGQEAVSSVQPLNNAEGSTITDQVVPIFEGKLNTRDQFGGLSPTSETSTAIRIEISQLGRAVMILVDRTKELCT
jgi:hypothetical protein